MKQYNCSYDNKLFNSKINKSKRIILRNQATKPEQILWYCLKNKQLNGYKFRRQYGIEKFIVDFYCSELKLAIEIDGANHFFDEKSSGYDKRRQKLIEDNGIKVLRFTNTDVTGNIQGVLDMLYQNLPQPLLGKEGNN